MPTKKVQDVEAFLLRSDYFHRYILSDWVRRNPGPAKELIRLVRTDPVAEKEVQYHLTKVAEKKNR